jgi:hypothetical protein
MHAILREGQPPSSAVCTYLVPGIQGRARASHLIKEYESCLIGKYVHDWLKPGTTLATEGIIKVHTFLTHWRDQNSSVVDLTLIGGSSGITLLYQLNHALATHEPHVLHAALRE